MVRAYDEGIALRYHFPEASNGLFMHITGDLTSFAFAPGAKALHSAWAQGSCSWVSLEPKAWGEESERPLYMELENGLKVVLAEAGLHDFVRGKLKLQRDNVLQMAMYGSADIITPYDMPWRVVMVGEKAVDLINNKQLILNLNEPCRITDTSFIKPGKAFRSGQLDDVFVNEDTERIIARAQELQLDYLQLHGNESPDTCRTLHRKGFRIIKALAPKAVSDFSLTTAYAPYCDYLLFDTPCTGFGGSGEKFDWTLLKHYKGETPFLLSGGIRPESLNDLLAFRHPRWAGIDLNSGFETAPGIKDAEKLKTFIERINNVSMNNVLIRE